MAGRRHRRRKMTTVESDYEQRKQLFKNIWRTDPSAYQNNTKILTARMSPPIKCYRNKINETCRKVLKTLDTDPKQKRRRSRKRTPIKKSDLEDILDLENETPSHSQKSTQEKPPDPETGATGFRAILTTIRKQQETNDFWKDYATKMSSKGRKKKRNSDDRPEDLRAEKFRSVILQARRIIPNISHEEIERPPLFDDNERGSRRKRKRSRRRNKRKRSKKTPIESDSSQRNVVFIV